MPWYQGFLLPTLFLLAWPSLGFASEASATSEQLLGWSEDGTTWAVLAVDEASGEEELLIMRASGVVFRLCSSEEDPYGGESNCTADKKTKVIHTESSDKHSALQRVNIEGNKYLKSYKLKRISGKWRKGFKKKFSLKATDYRASPMDGKCNHKWLLLRRVDSKEVGKHGIKEGCLSAKGGYLHPNEKFVLVKQMHNQWSTGDDEFWTLDELSYVFVPLK